MYPSLVCAFNICKETKLMCSLQLEGYTAQDMEDFFTSIAAPKENAVHVCHKFFNLPNYKEIDGMF